MTLDTRHAFAELGLTPGATAHEVKAAWRRLVSHWHPDRNSSAGAVARMQRINDAFRIIHRAGLGATPEAAPRTGKPPAPPPASASPPSSPPSPPPPPPASPPRADDAARSRAHAGARAKASADAHARAAHAAGARAKEPDDDGPRRTVHRKVRLTLEEAAAGCTKVLQGKVVDTCESCSGRGYRLPESACVPCEGSGEVKQPAWFGWLNTRLACEGCGGKGTVRIQCVDCHGTGKLDVRRYQVNARIPHGVRGGDMLNVSAQRTRSQHAAVDLHLRVELIEHPLLKLDEDRTVRCEMPVDGFAWIANRSISVPTLTGLQPLALNRDRLTYRLKNVGYPLERRGARGDQVVTVQPIFPERLNADQDILLDQLIAALSGPEGHASDHRLRTWQRELRAWERSLHKHEAPGH